MKSEWTPATVILVGIAIIVSAVLILGALSWYGRYEKCATLARDLGGSSAGCLSWTAP